MKKILSFILTIILIIVTLTGCVKQFTNKNDNNLTNEKTNNSKLEKFEGTITNAMPFSESYAFISTDKEAYSFTEYRRNICITENGKIAFSLPSGTDTCYAGFKNGNALVKINNELCVIDTKGNVVISPQKNGYTNAILSIEAFDDGYLPVYLESSDYTGSTFKYGVLNTKGEWIVALTNKYLSNYDIEELSRNYAEDYKDGHIRFKSLNSGEYDFWWSLKDGTITNDIVSDTWLNSFDRYYDENENIKLELSSKKEIPNNSRGTAFNSGSNYTYFYFSTAFFTIIDRQGNFLFDPLPTKSFDTAGMDEKTKICYSLTEKNELKIYDLQGNLKISLIPQYLEHNIEKIAVYPNDDGKGYLIYEKFFDSDRTSGEKYYYIDEQGKIIID